MQLDEWQKQFIDADASRKAIAIVERRTDWIEVRNPVTWAMEKEDVTPPRVLVRHLERGPAGDFVYGCVDRVRELAWSNDCGADETGGCDGCGWPVVDILRRDKDLLQRACELNSGTIAGLVLMFEGEQLEMSRELPDAGRLIEELVRYRRDEGFQDDLVLACRWRRGGCGWSMRIR